MSLRIASLALTLLLAVAAGPAPASDVDEATRRISEARAYADQDKNAQAALAYERAVEVDPSVRTAVLVEWADQLLWADRTGAAIARYREFLAGNPPLDEAHHARRQLALALAWNGDLEESRHEYETLLAENPDDVGAKLGLAQTLSWADLQGPARSAYQDVLRRDAGNAEAMRGMGRVQSWRGKQRDARRRLASYLLAHPGDAEASYLLAQAQQWMGRTDLALDTLERHLAAHPGDVRAEELRDRIRFQLRPVANLIHDESHQSDHLRISSTRFGQDFHFNEGLTTVGPRYQFLRYDPSRSDIVDEIFVQRPGIYGRHRFNDAFELTGDVFVDLIDTDYRRGSGGDDAILTYNAWATFWPDDALRFDVGSSRTTFDNTKSLRKGISAVYAAASGDYLPDEKTRFSTRFNWGDYSDGNERSWWQFEAARRVLYRPALTVVGYRYTGMDFSETTNNGYYEPDWYHANEATFESEFRASSRLSLRAEGSAGVEVEKSRNAKFIWSAGAQADYQLAERLSFEIHYRYFSSDQGASGFSRGTGGAGLRFVW